MDLSLRSEQRSSSMDPGMALSERRVIHQWPSFPGRTQGQGRVAAQRSDGNDNVLDHSVAGLPSPRFAVNTTPLIAADPQSQERARRADGEVDFNSCGFQAQGGELLASNDGDALLQFFSEDAAGNEEREKIIKESCTRVRFSANDRSVPASDQQ